MKKLYLTAIILICIMVVFQSCSKQSKEMIAPVSPNVINATIAPNQSYTFTINTPGELNIEKQASHYKISKAGLDENDHPVYEYLPAQDYRGKDEIVLSNRTTTYTSEGGSGCNNNHTDNSVITSSSTSYITIRLSIAN